MLIEISPLSGVYLEALRIPPSIRFSVTVLTEHEETAAGLWTVHVMIDEDKRIVVDGLLAFSAVHARGGPGRRFDTADVVGIFFHELLRFPG
jgi:hypothetical protein